MLNTYVKNKGTTQMLIRNNNTNKFNELKWDADYDGETANISLDSTINGRTNHYNIELDNEDLANLLNVPSVNIPIDKRLKMNLDNYNQNVYKIELPNTSSPKNIIKSNTIEDLLDTLKQSNNSFLSSPLPNEELIVPVSINKKSSTKKHHKKTHKTYKVYKKNKSSTNKIKSSSKTKYQRL